ncbi:LysR family transcriptional regulator [Streptomyces sp. NRRL F-5122]|uniref:LysR family transcriptional regulator n=1 Tax=Streptomyces sp. NRRL F-5122 TaxID=1609098 RepID=UPI00099EAB0E|nr:LysR family transcriptional regulator [Streptomyces sp. NRRL F-5122]
MATLRALECLVALVDTGSVTKAAVALHMSQPALSHQIASLERELGTPVVERLSRGVRVTAAGLAAAAEGRVALRAAERAVQAGRDVAAGGAGRLRLACRGDDDGVASRSHPEAMAFRPARCAAGTHGVHQQRQDG